MTEQRVATLVVEVAGRKSNLESVLRALQTELRSAGDASGRAADQIGTRLAGGTDKAARSTLQLLTAAQRLATEELKAAQAAARIATEQAKADVAQNRAARSAAQLAQAQQRVAQAEQQVALTSQRVATETARTEAAQSRAAQAALRLEQAQQRVTSGAGAYGRLAGAVSGLQTAFGALGVGIGVQAAIQFGSAAVAAANQLERSQATLRAVAGSQEVYNRAVAIATANQRLFGGSLQANLAPLQQFLFIANRTGASLEELNRVAQLLAAVNPAEGIAGAGFALSEAFSGDLTSIVERFNVPRAAMRELLNEAEGADEILAGVTALLAEQGVTAETLAASLDTTAQSYVELTAELDKLKTSVGAGLANFFEQPTIGLSRLIGLINQNPKAIAELKALLSGRGEITGEDIERETQNLARRRATEGLAGPNTFSRGGVVSPDLVQQFGGAEQFDAIIERIAALQQAGGPAAEAIARLNEQFRQGGVEVGAYRERLASIEQINADPLIAIGEASARLATDFQAGTVEAALLDGRMQALAGTSDATRLAVAANAQAYADGRITAAELEGAIAALEFAQQAQADASDVSQGATLGLADSLVAAAGAIEGTTLASQAQKAALETAAQAAFDAENADKSLEDQARAAAQALFDAGGAGAAAAAQLAGSSSQVDVLTAAFYRLLVAKEAALGGSGGRALGGLGENIGAGAGRATAAIRELNRVYGAGPLAPRPTSGRGGGGGGGRASQAERELSQLAEQERRFQQQRLTDQERIARELQEAEQAHYERLLDIQAEYEERSLEQQRENEVGKRRSRFDFYDDLTASDLPQDIQQQLSAAYEQAFLEAQQYSQEGKAKLAADYLALKQEHIAAEQDFLEAVEQARKDKNQAEVDRLTRLAELRREAEAEELKQLVEGEDSNVNARDEALAEESLRYQEEQDKIAGTAEEAARRKLEASEKSIEAIRAETLALKEQADLLATLNQQKLGSTTPASPVAATPGTGDSTPPSVTLAADTVAALKEAQAAAGAPGVGLLAGKLDRIAELLSEVVRAIDSLDQRRPFTPNN